MRYASACRVSTVTREKERDVEGLRWEGVGNNVSKARRRCLISAQDLRVNVDMQMSVGGMLKRSTKAATRLMIVSVLPLPGPAMMNNVPIGGYMTHLI